MLRRSALPSVAISLFLFATPSGAASPKGSFTLEQVLSAPFSSDLVSCATQDKVAWVFNTRGARNIWVAEAPDFKGRPVTSYSEDDGQEISDVGFTPDAKSLVFVRGGNANRKGEIPNPLNKTEGAEQAIWTISITPASAPRRLAEGHSPAVSPKGDRVVYIVKDQVWWVPLEGNEKPAQTFRARGDCAGLRWSPEGSRFAFVSRRGDHTWIGVFDVAAKSVRYLDPSVDRDVGPVWSPDGQHIAFLRIPSSRAAQSFGPRREGPPWSIRVAEIGSGQAREIFHAEPKRGSVFHAVVAEEQLFWGVEDRIVFPWERDGWTHLYSVSASAASRPAVGPVLLTPGEFEVEYVRLSPDRRSIVFNSNQDDIDRRHIWSVPVSGGKPAAVTSGKGIEWAAVFTSDGKALVFFRSDARRPPHPVIQSGSGPARELAPGTIPADFPESSLVAPEPVLFPAADGMRIHGQLFLPRGIRPDERRPAAIFFHGGSRRQMLLGWHYMYYYRNAYAFNQYLTSRGFIVLSVNYRSGIGYGTEFREAINYGATGASEFQDVVGAGLYLRGRPDVDSDRIALWGGSYGGYLTALGLARASDLFAAGVDFHGVHDWSNRIVTAESGGDPDSQREIVRRAFESSPMASVKSWRSPVLLIHGDDDRNVAFSQSVDLTEALRQQGVAVEQLIFADEIHDFLVHAHWLLAYRAAAEFLQRKLGERSRLPGQH